MNFILVPGHNTLKSTYLVQKSTWQQFLENQFPGFHIEVYYYHYDMFNHAEVENSINGLENLINRMDGNVVLLGYSFGGFISRLVLQRSSVKNMGKVSALVTMGTPFQVPNERQRKFLEGFSLASTINVPLLAFGGWLDPFAFPIFLHPRGPDFEVKNFLFCTHGSFFFSKRIRNKVVERMKKFLAKRSL